MLPVVEGKVLLSALSLGESERLWQAFWQGAMEDKFCIIVEGTDICNCSLRLSKLPYESVEKEQLKAWFDKLRDGRGDDHFIIKDGVIVGELLFLNRAKLYQILHGRDDRGNIILLEQTPDIYGGICDSPKKYFITLDPVWKVAYIDAARIGITDLESWRNKEKAPTEPPKMTGTDTAGTGDAPTPLQTMRKTIAGETACKKWLTKLMTDSNGKKPIQTKQVYQSDAIETYKISERAFLRAWANAIQESGATQWRSPGRKS